MRSLLALMCLLALTSVAAIDATTFDERLVTAAAAQQTDVVRALLSKGVDANSRRADGVTALLLAAHWDDVLAADLLLKAGAKVDAADDHGVTPLSRACENASPTMVERLLAAAANPNAAQDSGLTPLMIAARTGNLGVVNALLRAGAHVDTVTQKTHETALMWAVAGGHRQVVSALIAQGATVNSMPQQAFSPLMRAAKNGDIDTAKLLLAAGARLDDAGSDGTDPLVYALVSGQASFAHFLLDQGANPNGAIDGTTALHAAAGDVNTWLKAWTRRHGGSGPYYLEKPRLKLEERLPLVTALLAKGANPNARTTASEMIVGGFLRNGAFDNFTIGTGDVSGATPLWIAAYSMNGGGGFGGAFLANVVRSTGAIMRALLNAGADANARTADGTTPLMAAAGCGWSTYTPGKPRADRRPTAEEAVKILIEEAGSPVNTVNEAEFTPLHCASYGGLNEVVEYLVAHGAAINARDWRGRTPYRLAEGAKQNFQFQDWPATAELLKSLGADPTLGIPGSVQERLRSIDGQQ